MLVVYFVFVKLTICEAAAYRYINSATICPSLKYMFDHSATQIRLHIKLGRVVDPIKTYILCENQEFLQTS